MNVHIFDVSHIRALDRVLDVMHRFCCLCDPENDKDVSLQAVL